MRPSGEGLSRVGQVVGSHGLKGELKVAPLTDFAERFRVGQRLLARGVWRKVEGVRWHKERPLLRLEGIEEISAAEALKWEYLEAEGAAPTAEDEFLMEDLVGSLVVLENGREIGRVNEVLALPAQDVLCIGETLIPLIEEFVLDVDLEARRILVRLIPGMAPGEDPL